ncbi:MAG: RDD family protein [Deltaproteobacteria bacterium]|nr:RDD family protein [Deltaproteobacteria bacterium]
MAKLVVREGGADRTIVLGAQVTIGRQPDNRVVLADVNASRRHAAVVLENGRYILQDLGSANGTFVNGARASRHPLVTGDVVQIGAASLRFEEEAPPADPAFASTLLGVPGFAETREAILPAATPRPPAPVPAPRPVAVAIPAPVASVAAAQALLPALESTAFAYAGFWRRFAAVLIDGILLGVPFAVLQRALFGLLGGTDPKALALGFALLQGVVTLLYFARWESSVSGATLGKKVLGIRVVDESGARAGFGKALGRNLAKIVSGAVCGLGYLVAAFTLRKRAWHDSLAGCLVIKAGSMPSNGAASACRACGAVPRLGISYCTQCGQRLG